MKKENWWMGWFVVILILVVVALQWLRVDQQTAYDVYGFSLSFENNSERTISWLSSQAIEGVALQLKHRAERWEDARVFEADQHSYKDHEGKMVYSYHVQIKQLEGPNDYTYRITASDDILSEDYTFAVAGEEESFQFIHIADSQGKTEEDFKQWGITLQAAVDAAPQAAFIVHSGDMTDDPTIEQQWKWFYRYAQPLAEIPLLPTTGNHEQIDGDASSFSFRFYMPSNGAEDSLEDTTYYTVYQNALYISLNTEGNIDGQTKWLKQVLSEHAAQWIIVSTHRGIYGASRFKDGDDWAQLFEQYGVDIVLQGHNHQYSRTYPLIGGRAVNEQEKGPIYVTMNASGTKFNEEKKAKDYQAIAFQNGQPMYGVIEVSPNVLTYSAYDISGKMLDQFSITK